MKLYKMKLYKMLYFLFGALLLVACGGGGGKNENSGCETPVENAGPASDALREMPPESHFILVEQAVDSWMYFHLLNYDSYKPLIRKTDYDTVRNLHIHHVRYRATNKTGGAETHEKTFEVRLALTPAGLEDFDVKDVSGAPNPTEIAP